MGEEFIMANRISAGPIQSGCNLTADMLNLSAGLINDAPIAGSAFDPAKLAKPVPSVPQLAKLAADTAAAYEKKIADALEALACDEITINDARVRMGLDRAPIERYNIKLHESGVNNGKDIMQRRYAAALFGVIMGGKSVNEVLTDAGLPPINDKRADKKLIVASEPEPIQIDAYMSRGPLVYEIQIQTGPYRGTNVKIRFADGNGVSAHAETIQTALRPFWLGYKKIMLAYDPFCPTITIRKALDQIGAVPMRSSEAAKAIEEQNK